MFGVLVSDVLHESSRDTCCVVDVSNRFVTMFSWINKDDHRKHEPEVYASVAEGLKKIYQQVYVFAVCSFALLLYIFVYVIQSVQPHRQIV